MGGGCGGSMPPEVPLARRLKESFGAQTRAPTPMPLPPREGKKMKQTLRSARTLEFMDPRLRGDTI